MTRKIEKPEEFCTWIYYDGSWYYETNCGQQMEGETHDAVEPDYCPWCGGKIEPDNY